MIGCQAKPSGTVNSSTVAGTGAIGVKTSGDASPAATAVAASAVGAPGDATAMVTAPARPRPSAPRRVICAPTMSRK
jgi:hypothetical protein